MPPATEKLSSMIEAYMTGGVIGHHGTSRVAAESIARDGFRPSVNEYDWLGDGSYFWENNRGRAAQWAIDLGHTDPVVIEVGIDLADCMDLTDPAWFKVLIRSADRILDAHKRAGLPTLKQRGMYHGKDRFVINRMAEELAASGHPLSSVRGAFSEGDPAYPGSAI